MKMIKKISTKTVVGNINAKMLPEDDSTMRPVSGDWDRERCSGWRIELRRVGMSERSVSCGQSGDWRCGGVQECVFADARP